MRNTWKAAALMFTWGSLSYPLASQAEVRLSGYFQATQNCPAYVSLRKQTNPDQFQLQSGQMYRLLAQNNTPASYYLIETPTNPKQRWVALNCGTINQAAPDNASHPVNTTTATATATATNKQNYILAISWQPAFCEGHNGKPECKSQTASRFDANHFTLHGLWPQPMNNIYCAVSPSLKALDEASRWSELPSFPLADATASALHTVMPGMDSHLERHEWIKHGTCYQPPIADIYFQHSLKLLQELNQSAVQTLFASHIGAKVTAREIQQAFTTSFGADSASKIKIACGKDGARRLITEITLSLSGDLGQSSLAQALQAAPSSRDVGCTDGLVDAVGLQ